MSKWRRSRNYRIWRIGAIRKYKVCACCGSLKNRHVHHKNHATYFKEDRYNVDKAEVLCSKCHIQYHTNYHRSFKEKCTEYDFDNFMSLVKYIKGIRK